MVPMSESLDRRLAAIVGAAHVITDPGAFEPYVKDWRGRYQGRPRCIIRPASTAEVSAVVRACAEHRVAMVPQGGNTGVCGGAIPDGSGEAVVIGLGRMNRVRAVDAANNSIIVDAGCILADIHRRAEEMDRIFPLDLGSDGSCQIGGNVSSNAGGTAVLRYGNMRELVLGLEVVLPDGRVLDGLRGLRKDNTGYDLKQIFIGAEGTLGIVTGAVLKLFQKPRAAVTAFAALPSPEAALALLGRMRAACGDRLTGFELFSAAQLAAVLAQIPGTRRPVAADAPWFALIESVDNGEEAALRALCEASLEDALAAEEIQDAAVAQSRAEAAQFWRLRHTVSEANVKTGRVVSHDTSVPVSRIPEFIAHCATDLVAAFPRMKLHIVGHVGDGNVHVVAIFPRTDVADPAVFEATARQANALVHDVAVSLGGSIGAEHGVGQSLRDQLPLYKGEVELDLMRGLKSWLDPLGLMNPGKVVSQNEPGRQN